MLPRYGSSSVAAGPEMEAVGNCGGSLRFSTSIDSVVWLKSPARSVTRTVKTLAPTSALPGVPPRLPSAATVSHAGPLILENSKTSPRSTSLAEPASVAMNVSSSTAGPAVGAPAVNAGASLRFATVMVS